MKGIQKFIVVYGIVITCICLYIVILSYFILNDSRSNSAVLAEPIVTTAIEEDHAADTAEYRLAVQSGQVVILKDKIIFETTGIEEKDMNEELRREVEQSISFDSAEEVYAFLESCSS